MNSFRLKDNHDNGDDSKRDLWPGASHDEEGSASRPKTR